MCQVVQQRFFTINNASGLKAVVDSIRAKDGNAVAVQLAVGREADVLAEIQNVSAPGQLRMAIFNVGKPVAAPRLELSAYLFERTLRVWTLGGFLFAQGIYRAQLEAVAARCCSPGRISLSQSFAHEFGPQNIHVAHVVIDGSINRERVRSRARNVTSWPICSEWSAGFEFVSSR